MKVPASLIKRQKHHFQELPNGVHLTLGCNGFIWVGSKPSGLDPSLDFNEKQNEGSNAMDTEESVQEVTVPLEERKQICRVAVCIKALAKLGFAIYPASILNVYNWSQDLKVEIRDILGSEFLKQVVEAEAKRREGDANKS